MLDDGHNAGQQPLRAGPRVEPLESLQMGMTAYPFRLHKESRSLVEGRQHIVGQGNLPFRRPGYCWRGAGWTLYRRRAIGEGEGEGEGESLREEGGREGGKEGGREDSVEVEGEGERAGVRQREGDGT